MHTNTYKHGKSHNKQGMWVDALKRTQTCINMYRHTHTCTWTRDKQEMWEEALKVKHTTTRTDTDIYMHIHMTKSRCGKRLLNTHGYI